jgi:hypothetical protein
MSNHARFSQGHLGMFLIKDKSSKLQFSMNWRLSYPCTILHPDSTVFCEEEIIPSVLNKYKPSNIYENVKNVVLINNLSY